MKIEGRTNTYVDASSTEAAGDAPPAVKVRRTSSAGVLQELGELNAARLREHQEQAVHRRRASFAETMAAPEGAAPALHELIGRERAGALDACSAAFNRRSTLPPMASSNGSAKGGYRQVPRCSTPGVSSCRTPSNVPSLTSQDVKGTIDIDALKRGEKKYMWAVSALGRLHRRIRAAGKDPETQRERYRGHPLLVGGGTARICGELHFNSATDKFVVSNQSGRYSRYEDRTEAGLNEV
ncbi:hypothetical protein AWV80_02215, partial [Cupriavidus sp. UYMU48A]